MPDWSKFTGPQHYEPDKVDGALAALESASSREQAQAAYDRVLFAIGNNHGGTLYPAAAAAAPEILKLAIDGTGWHRWGAFEVLVELTVFDAEPGFEEFIAPGGGRINLKCAVRDLLRDAKPRLFLILNNQSAEEEVRNRHTRHSGTD